MTPKINAHGYKWLNDLEKAIDVKICYLGLSQQRRKYLHTVTPKACLKY